jgi:very-short-patch-repair endonuclease
VASKIGIGQHVGSGKMECAKDLRRTVTPEERLLWRELRTNRLESLHFRRQQIIDGFIEDFYCHAARIALKVDGAIHAK